VQRWIDEGGLQGRAATAAGLCEIHRRFGELLPESLLWVEEPDTGERMRMVPSRGYSRKGSTKCEERDVTWAEKGK
jgi:hypothetical protein